MAKCKHNFSKEELEQLYNKHGSYAKAAKELGVSKGTFRQQYLKSQGKCMTCGSNIPEDHNSYTCETCLNKNRVEDKPDSKPCEYCDKTIHRKEGQSKISWSKKRGCETCISKRNEESLKKTKDRYRVRYNESIRLSPKTKEYQKKYRQSKKGKQKRRVSNAKRRASKQTTASPNINDYINQLYQSTPECPYCSSKDNLSIDHKTPLSRGGTHTENNVELICLSCNLQKGNKTKDEYMQYLNTINQAEA